MHLLTEIDQLLLSSLDHEVILDQLADHLVPAFASHLVLRAVDDGEWGRIVLAHSIPGGESFAEELKRRFPIDRESAGGVHRVLQEGAPILYEVIDQALAEEWDEDHAYLTILSELGIESAVFAPLIARGHLRGSLALFTMDQERRFSPADLIIVQDLATRIALSMDNAQLFSEVEAELQERRRAEIALRESEARFRVMADMAPVLIWMSDLEGKSIFFNKPWLEFTGRSNERESGDGWLDGVHPDDREGYHLVYAEAFERREPVVFEYRLRRHDGEYRWILDHGVPRFETDGEFVGYIGSCIDISPQIEKRHLLMENAAHLEELTTELEHTIDELELRRREADIARATADDANRAKGRFLAVMSHELRTPLNAILSYSDLLEAEVAGPINEDQRVHLHRIKQSSLHLLDLINRILSFSRIEAGEEDIDLEEIDLRELAVDMIALMEPQARRKNLTLQTDIPTTQVLVTTDPGKIRQILLNLLSNAVKFTDEGGIEFVMVAAADGVAFEVRDTGSGIAESDLDRIFEAFVQADQTRTRRLDGTGLGLTVSRELARLLGGDIGVQSIPGEGSIFTLRLPLEVYQGSAH